MSADLSYVVPFLRWSRTRVEALLPTLAERAPGARLSLAEPDEDGAMELRVRVGRRSGALVLLPGDDDTSASIHLPIGELDPGLTETLDQLASALAELLGGTSEEEPEAEAVVQTALAEAHAPSSFADLRAELAERWTVQDDEDERVTVIWSWEGTDRTQLILLEPVETLDEIWVRLRSYIAPISRMEPGEWWTHDDPDDAVRLRLDGEDACFQINLPLACLNPARLGVVLAHLAQLADDLEEQLTGTDTY